MVRALSALALVAVLLAGCGGHKPNVAACEQAMRQQFATAMANPNGPDATRPAECKGVDDTTLQNLASKILAGN